MDTASVHLRDGEIVGDFTVRRQLGEGGCGVVYKVMSNKNKKRYAMKVEPTSRKKTDQLLPLEAQVLKRLQFSQYAAEFVEYGKCQADNVQFRVLIMGLLGQSISSLQDQQSGYTFDLGTVLRIGIQALRAIAFLHSIYFVHRDVKPSNFAVDHINSRRIYLIDYGLSRSLKKRGCRRLRTPREDVPFRGTPAYCSLNAHQRKEHGRHDDLWSLMYMLVDLRTGTLPWLKHSRASTAILKEKLMDMEYMHGCPVTFSAILNYLRGLTYFQRPDYVGLERLFILMMQARNVSQSQPMSWETNVIRHDHKGRARNTKAQMEEGAKSCHASASGTLKYTLSGDSSS